jgi:UDP-N-acetylmuramoyl-L-alanyl-D-glutamate--2,6-diaminopimelate ligase
LTTLADLLAPIGVISPAGAMPVSGVTADSRQVEAGFVFFAIPGAKADGMEFAGQAIARGAIAVVGKSAPPGALAVPFVEVRDVRAALSRAAARLHPGQPGVVAAVTGTSGKTSVAAFTRQIWLALGHSAAALGTTGVVSPSGAVYGSLTTPDPVTLHRTLAELAQDGVTHLAMEASSHGLDQRRLDGVRLSAGGFTNLSRDHLDYHATLEDYLSAKLRLFEELLQPGQPAVIDADSDVADRVIAACTARGLKVFTTGRAGRDLRIVHMQTGPASTRLTIGHDAGEQTVELPLAGDFMASNALVAAGLAIVTGNGRGKVLEALANLEGAPGRLEKIGERDGGPAFVDYAHKPDALEKVLRALKPLATRRLIVVFGCGGDRDAGKRPIMGEIAARLADVVIVTDDNPRSEDPGLIRRAILEAAPRALEIGDRREAISRAVSMLGRGDVLVVAGKGHETGQIVGRDTLPFSDHEALRAALREHSA